MQDLYVAILRVSPKVADKINGLHHISAEEVWDEVGCQENLIYVWHTHPKRGLRALVDATIQGRAARVVLYPTDIEGVYNLGTAYFRP